MDPTYIVVVTNGGHAAPQQVPHQAKGLTTWAATILIVGEIAGVGILALTDAAVKAGLASFAMLPFFCILSSYTAHLLCQCWSIVRVVYPEYAGHVPNPYPVIGLKSFGKWGQFIVTSAINVTLFGASVVFIVLASQLIDGVATSYNYYGIPLCLWMIIIGLTLIPLTWLGTPKDFWWIAVFAAVATAVACAFVVTNTARSAPNVPSSDKAGSANVQDFFLALGTIMFAFSGHPGFPTIAIDMKKPENFTKSSAAAYLVVFLMYLPVAVLGYITFGHAVNDNIVITLDHYLHGDAINTAIQVLICVHILSGFTIVINPLLQHTEELFHMPNKLSISRIGLRTAIVLLALFVALSIPRFGVLVSLVGSSANAMLVYVIPCICYIRLKRLVVHDTNEERMHLNRTAPLPNGRLAEPIPPWEKMLLYIVIAIGLFAVVTGTVTSILSIAGTNTFVPPCYVNFNLVLN